VSKLLKTTFILDVIIAGIVGALLLIIPGRSLGWIGWAPIEPLLFRLLGAALIAMAWSSYGGFRAKTYDEVKILVQMQAVFCSLGALGFLRHLVVARFPMEVWVVFGVLLVAAILWVVALVKK
jgi:hypothetical protein